MLHSSQRDNIRVGNEPCDSKYEKASPMLAWSEVFLYLLALGDARDRDEA